MKERILVQVKNPRKYGLGSLRKTPHGEHSTHRPRYLVRQSALKPTTNETIHANFTLILKISMQIATLVLTIIIILFTKPKALFL